MQGSEIQNKNFTATQNAVIRVSKQIRLCGARKNISPNYVIAAHGELTVSFLSATYLRHIFCFFLTGPGVNLANFLFIEEGDRQVDKIWPVIWNIFAV